jgi:hypothetical protein
MLNHSSGGSTLGSKHWVDFSSAVGGHPIAPNTFLHKGQAFQKKIVAVAALVGISVF